MLENNIAELQENINTLESEIEQLKKDPFYIEKVGREKFMYIKPGDRVYKVVPKDDRGQALDE